jgi:hypothetical protein
MRIRKSRYVMRHISTYELLCTHNMRCEKFIYARRTITVYAHTKIALYSHIFASANHHTCTYEYLNICKYNYLHMSKYQNNKAFYTKICTILHGEQYIFLAMRAAGQREKKEEFIIRNDVFFICRNAFKTEFNDEKFWIV